MEEENYSFADSESSSRYAVLRKYLEDALQSNQKTDHREETVTLQQYMAVVKEFELEREAHKKTQRELVEAQDKLAFALGEVEILRKQIEREKAQFEITFGSLTKQSSGNGPSSFKNDVSDEPYTPECDVISDVKQNRLSFRDQLSELNVQMQQDLYISKLIEQSSGTSSGPKNRRNTASDSGKYPSSSNASFTSRERRDRTAASNDSFKYLAPSSGMSSARTSSTTFCRK